VGRRVRGLLIRVDYRIYKFIVSNVQNGYEVSKINSKTEIKNLKELVNYGGKYYVGNGMRM
jgi:hypothetical protein